MSRIQKIIALLLLFSLAQSFAPLVRMATETSCCMREEPTAQGCCQKAQPETQIKCCPGEALPGAIAAVPSVPVSEKNLPLQVAALASNAEISLPTSVNAAIEIYSSFNPHYSNNHRYLLSSSLLL